MRKLCIFLGTTIAVLWLFAGVAIAADPCIADSIEPDEIGANAESDTTDSTATASLDTDAAAPGPNGDTKYFNLDMLIARLKETDALGVFTKLALKGDVEDIIEMAHEYQSLAALTELQLVRDQFDGLVLKTVTLLNDKDPDLAADMYQARDLVWQSILEVEI
ncbi:MAG: hypothetical protein OES26_12945 [Gammaproteobacteria bacterium]|nr:hypothetical protein [Gammaproteobacteria bacterium]